MKKIVFTLVVISFSLVANAQWRIGGTVGATYNLYSRDNHYMSDWHYQGAWGRVRNIYFGSLGVMGQYDVNDWLGIRADLNWTMKNHRQYRTMISRDYETQNSYIQLPVMASFSFGGQKLRGFLNAGVYGGYWLCSYDNIKILSNSDYIIDVTQNTVNVITNTTSGMMKNDLDEKHDQRFDNGFVGGVGVEWRFNLLKKNWSWQIIEARIYYSTRSIQKDYMTIKDPRYNTTFAFQSGLCYFF